MSIFGATFKPHVIRQLETRQALISDGIGAPKRSRNVQLYTSGKTAWCRLSSFVDYSPNPADPSQPPSDKLARKYVLQSGTLIPSETKDTDFAMRFGVGNANGSYGSNLGNRDLGLRPMPGITSINVVNKGAYGSLRLTTVKFKAWDKAQLDDLEILFMRTGYPVLVEWGWSMYMDTSDPNDKDYKATSNLGHLNFDTSKYISKDIRTFTDPTINPFTAKSQDDIYDDILRFSHQFSGNYDGMVGIVQNFTHELMPNGSFDCTTVLVSIGDTLDSIKMNRPAKIVAGKDNVYKTGFTQLMEDLLSASGTGSNPGVHDLLDPNVTQVDISLNGRQLLNSELQTLNRLKKYQAEPGVDTSIVKLEGFNFGVSSTTAVTNPVTSYIQLAYLIAVIKEGFNLFTEKGGHLLNIELPVYGKSGNKGNGLCLASVDSVSVDPSICLIKNRQATWITGNSEDGYDVKTADNRSALSKEFLVEEENTDSSKLGIIGNVYMNMQYVSKKFTDILNSSSDGEVHLYSFIKALLVDVSKALGSINDFDIFVEDNNAIIIDKHYTELSSATSTSSKFQINIFGINTVVRGYKILSKIFQSQINMMAISAGSDRLNLGGVNSSTQAYFNYGLSNRLIGNLTTDANPDSSADSIKQEKVELAKSVLDIRDYLKGMIAKDPKEKHFPVGGESIAAASTVLNSIILNVNSDANYRSIIPLSVEITLDGIAGIAIGEIFRINTDVLPKEYTRKDLGFIVTGLHQDVLKSDWTTTIIAYPVLLNQTDVKKTSSTINLSLNEKKTLNTIINDLRDKEVAKQETYRLQYLRFLYFIKHYYENHLIAVPSLTTDAYDSSKQIKKYTAINNDGANTLYKYTVRGEQVNVQSIITNDSSKADSILMKYDVFKDAINFSEVGTGKSPHSFPLLNPIIRKSATAAELNKVLIDLIQSDGEYSNLQSEAGDLADDVITQANSIYDFVKRRPLVFDPTNLSGIDVTSTQGLKVPNIIPLVYDTSSPIDRPKFTQRSTDPNDLITVNYTGKIK